MAKGRSPEAHLAVEELHGLLSRLAEVLAARRQELDRINVFPVPDGDTGTNLLQTVRRALAESPSPDAVELPARVARGALLGARGNAGLIFAQFLRGFCEVVEEERSLGPGGLARALGRGRRLAYAAVATPVEGTILTAISAAATVAGRLASRQADLGQADLGPGMGQAGLGQVVEELLAAVHTAVAGTQQQLDALRRAGVVDAGARGFELFCEALRDFVTGQPTPADAPMPVCEADLPRVGAPTASSVLEVQYLMDAAGVDVEKLRGALADLGDSVVVAVASGILRAHVHTSDAGAAIEAGLAHGQPWEIQVTLLPTPAPGPSPSPAEPLAPQPAVAVGCVAVVAGAGARDVARQHGALVVSRDEDRPAGGLPPDSLTAAIREVAARRVVVLPGHPDVVPAALEAAERVRSGDGRDVVVIGAADSVPGVLSALAVCDPLGDVDVQVAGMTETAEACAAGSVLAGEAPPGRPWVRAVSGGAVVAEASNAPEALLALARLLGAAKAESLLLVVGAGVDPRQRREAVDALRSLAPSATLEVVEGGQRSSLFALGVEG